MKPPRPANDNRVVCDDCRHFRRSNAGIASVQKRTLQLRWCVALKTNALKPHQRLQCQRFLPHFDNPDQRTGAERWPNLNGNIECCRLNTKGKADEN
jgi:hypothetical protein